MLSICGIIYKTIKTDYNGVFFFMLEQLPDFRIRLFKHSHFNMVLCSTK